MSQCVRSRRGQVNLSGVRVATYAAAGTAAALSASTAEGVITHVMVNQLVRDTVVGGGATAIDLTFGATPHHLAMAHGVGTTNAATGYAFVVPTGFGSPGVDFAGFTAGAYRYVANLASMANVSSQSFINGNGTMAFNNGYSYSQFLNPGVGFLGVRFNGNQYGWVRVDMAGRTSNHYTVIDYAFGDPGEAIAVGQTQSIPAPGSLGALALGALGLANWRKRRVG